MAKTHSSLTFDELCEEAFGGGLHPWEFYQYDLSEYLQRRKGIQVVRKVDFQEMLIASMLPYMNKSDRVKIVTQAFKSDRGKAISPKEKLEQLKEKFAHVPMTVTRKPKKNGSK